MQFKHLFLSSLLPFLIIQHEPVTCGMHFSTQYITVSDINSEHIAMGAVLLGATIGGYCLLRKHVNNALNARLERAEDSLANKEAQFANAQDQIQLELHQKRDTNYRYINYADPQTYSCLTPLSEISAEPMEDVGIIKGSIVPVWTTVRNTFVSPLILDPSDPRSARLEKLNTRISDYNQKYNGGIDQIRQYQALSKINNPFCRFFAKHALSINGYVQSQIPQHSIYGYQLQQDINPEMPSHIAHAFVSESDIDGDFPYVPAAKELEDCKNTFNSLIKAYEQVSKRDESFSNFSAPIIVKIREGIIHLQGMSQSFKLTSAYKDQVDRKVAFDLAQREADARINALKAQSTLDQAKTKEAQAKADKARAEEEAKWQEARVNHSANEAIREKHNLGSDWFYVFLNALFRNN